MAINSTVADATGRSPNFLVYGTDLALPVDHALHHVAPNLAAQDIAQRMVELTAAARVAIADAADTAARYAKRSRRDVSFGVGDRVLLSTHNLCLIGSPKFR